MMNLQPTQHPQDGRYLVSAINRHIEQAASNGSGRKHLGASSIGKPCPRELWYSFHWAKRSSFNGRILRLFSRGQQEEARFIRYLRDIGCIVEDTTPSGMQFGFSAVDGHFGGSYDGIAHNVPGRDSDERILLEFKTHNDRSFTELVKIGVEDAKPEHFAQMQIYMHYSKTQTALYLAVNKNDDNIYSKFVPYESDIANKFIQRAEDIIYGETAPERCPNNFCWWCSYDRICKSLESADRNCRTCKHSLPTTDAKWLCKKKGAFMPDEPCEGHVFREELWKR